MKVTVYDVEQPDRRVDGQYVIGPEAKSFVEGDEVFLRERDYNADRFYFVATVVKRRWVYSDNEPGVPELRILVQRHKR